MRVPCILFALERERLPIHDRYRITQRLMDAPCPAFLCKHGNREAVIIESGIGAACTLRALDWLLHERAVQASLVLFAGFAGALQTDVSVGTLILAEEIVDLDGNRWSASGLGVLTTGPCPSQRRSGVETWRRGRVLTVNRFIGEPAEKLTLGANHHAIVVDMESAPFALRCSAAGIPWACLRVVSDDVQVPFTAEVAGLVEDGRVRMGRVASLVVRKPWLLPKLLRLARQTRYAADAWRTG